MWLLFNFKKFKFIRKFGTLQVGIRAQLERIKHISVCSDLKFAALNVFKTIFLQINEQNEKSLKTGKTKTQCVRSAGAKISGILYLCIYCLLGIGFHVL